MSKKYLYGALGLGALALIALGVAALPNQSEPAFGKTVEEMNRDLLQFRLSLAAKQDEMNRGELSAESRTELSAELGTFAGKLASYQGKLGDAWASFVAQLQTDIASLRSNLEAWNRTIAESDDDELSVESKARLSAELAIFANKLENYESDLK